MQDQLTLARRFPHGHSQSPPPAAPPAMNAKVRAHFDKLINQAKMYTDVLKSSVRRHSAPISPRNALTLMSLCR